MLNEYKTVVFNKTGSLWPCWWGPPKTVVNCAVLSIERGQLPRLVRVPGHLSACCHCLLPHARIDPGTDASGRVFYCQSELCKMSWNKRPAEQPWLLCAASVTRQNRWVSARRRGNTSCLTSSWSSPPRERLQHWSHQHFFHLEGRSQMRGRWPLEKCHCWAFLENTPPPPD